MSITNKIIKHPSLVYAADIQSICEPLKLLGITYFAHGNVNRNNQLSGLCSHPDYFKHYFEKGYYNYDLHMDNLPDTNTVLWDSIELYDQSNELNADFMAYSLGHTFSIIEKHDHSVDCYHFATHLGNEKINNQYYQQLGYLKQFIHYFKDKIKRDKTLALAYDIKFQLSPDTGSFNSKNQAKIASAAIHEFTKTTHCARLYLEGIDSYITQRELECLHWMSLGKTVDQVANLLDISPRTIKAHVRNMKDRVNCVSQFQLGILFQKLQK